MYDSKTGHSGQIRFAPKWGHQWFYLIYGSKIIVLNKQLSEIIFLSPLVLLIYVDYYSELAQNLTDGAQRPSSKVIWKRSTVILLPLMLTRIFEMIQSTCWCLLRLELFPFWVTVQRKTRICSGIREELSNPANMTEKQTMDTINVHLPHHNK